MEGHYREEVVMQGLRLDRLSGINNTQSKRIMSSAM